VEKVNMRGSGERREPHRFDAGERAATEGKVDEWWR
jgi:hypothetical protein